MVYCDPERLVRIRISKVVNSMCSFSGTMTNKKFETRPVQIIEALKRLAISYVVCQKVITHLLDVSSLN